MSRLVLLAALSLLLACPRGGREVISAAAGAPPAIGPYSQAVRVGNTLYLAGQIGIDAKTGALAPGGVGGQTRQALENCRAVLAAAGFTLADVVQAQVFLEDIDDFAAMNEVYATYFPQAPPARATVEVAELPRGAKVEIMLTAVR
jgi:2-iminobutanoate/2-iminopropanoate deaminase